MGIVYNADEIRELLSPGALLMRLGHRPLCVKDGYEEIYRSMLRPDPAGQLMVDTRLNLWFDRSGDNPSGIRCGDVIDLAKAIYHSLSFPEILLKLSMLAARTTPRRKRCAQRVPFYHVADIQPLGGNVEIAEYLRSQDLWELSLGQLKEVYYFTQDEKHRRKDFFAAGWPNENGGWEVRAKNFSGCIGPSGMSFIEGDPDRLLVFVHYTDYLGWRYAHRREPSSILVLNSPAFTTAALCRAKNFGEAGLYDGQDFVELDILHEVVAGRLNAA